MKVLHPEHNLPEDQRRFCLLDPLLSHNLIKQVPTLGVLHNQVQLLRGFNDLIKLYDKRVSEFFHDLELAGDSHDVGVLEDQVLFEDLDGHEFLGEFVLGELYLPEVALAQGAGDCVALEGLVLLLGGWVTRGLGSGGLGLVLVLDELLPILSNVVMSFRFILFFLIVSHPAHLLFDIQMIIAIATIK